MACKVRYLNSAGIHQREIHGISALAQAFPAEWLFYASLQCYPPKSHPIEIDALIVADDRVLLLELKDYNGTLTHNGDQWVLNGQPRGRSHVDVVSEKARKIKGLLSQTVPGISKFSVDGRVVLTGTATSAGLSDAERSSVLSLAEACSLSNTAHKTRLLGAGTIQLKKAFQFESEFERATRNPRLWRPREGVWDGYRVVEEDYVVHPRQIWSEHRAERVRDPRFRALLRLWSFDKLPPGLNSADHRRFIADRETRAIGLLHETGSRLVSDGSILLPTGEDKQEILTQHFELRVLPRDWTTLDRFLERSREELSVDDRLLVASTLLNLVAELHANGIAHRDLGPRCVWIGHTARLALSGFMSCQIPGERSLDDWYFTLRGYGSELPEDKSGTASGSGKRRDVYAVGNIIRQILETSKQAQSGSGKEPSDLGASLENLNVCLERATAVEPTTRYDSAVEMADAIALVLEGIVGEKIDQSVLDRAETGDIPYVRYPQERMLKTTPRVNVYLHRSPENELLCVKLWPGARRGTSVAVDMALIRLCEGVGRLILSPVDSLPRFVTVGLSPVGPFIVYHHVDGATLKDTTFSDSLGAVEAAERLLLAVDAMHAMDVFHGDINGDNIIVRADESGMVILDSFDFSEVGEGKRRTPDYCPEEWERLTEPQIDRYAALKISLEVLEASGDDRLTATREIITEELQRPSIETLEPALIALKRVLGELTAPAIPRFSLRSPLLAPGQFRPDDGHYYVRAQRPSRDRLQYSIAGVDRELVFELAEGAAPQHWFSNMTYGSLMHASTHAVRTRCQFDVETGEDQGFDEVLSFLESLIAAPISEEQAAVVGADLSSALDVSRYWRSLIELEETFLPEVEILRDLGARGSLAAYSYERLGGDFDFDAESTVEVRLNGRKLGEVDLNQTDERTLVIRYSSRSLATGDRVTLVDRRAKASLDRRRKAVDRILDDQAAISRLIGYFTPAAGAIPIDHGVEVEESILDGYGLNPGQKEAFRNIVRFGPVGLLQGPPGTGKTHFIAALVHWLVTEAGARKILIASQSHEAVNNAIEKLVDLFKGLKRRPNLLRIGSKGITQKIRPYHTSSLRDRYRVRFDTAFKHRVIALGSAVGLTRDFVSEAVEIERLMGKHVRRIQTLTEAAKNVDGMTGDDKRRYDSAMRSAVNAASAAGRKLLGREIEASRLSEELQAVYRRLIEHHTGTSPADVAKVRGIIALSVEWSAALASSHRNFEEFLAKTRTIVTATCVGVGQTRIRIDAKTYDWVIVDEAARCTPGELAVPIQLGRRVLLVGDHLQLRPMIERRVLDRLAEDMPAIPRAELTQSDFERVYRSSFGTSHGQVFTEQYRMNEPICRLVSRAFYEPNEVRLWTSDKRKTGSAFIRPLPRPLNVPITWIDTSEAGSHFEHKAEWNKHSFWNSAEVAATMTLLERISDMTELVDGLVGGDSETPIGIICMYSAQKVKMEQAFAQRPWEARFRRLVRIDTVDSYQGKENEIVIASLVRCNKRRESGHVGSPNRCNVALSRAKERLFIVGARRTWMSTPSAHPIRRVLAAMRLDRTACQVLRAGEI